MPCQWLNTNEAAKYLKLHPATIRRLIRAGYLEAMRVPTVGRPGSKGGRMYMLRICRNSLLRWLRQQGTLPLHIDPAQPVAVPRWTKGDHGPCTCNVNEPVCNDPWVHHAEFCPYHLKAHWKQEISLI